MVEVITGGAVRTDAHVHFWSTARDDYGWLTPDQEVLYRDYGPDDLRPHLARNGIERVVAVQAAQSVAETAYLLAIAHSTDFVAGVVGWVPFDAAEGPAELARLAADPWLRGVRPMIQDIADDDWMLGTPLIPTFEAVAAHDLAFDALVYPRHLTNLLRLIDRHPNLRVLVDHGAKPQIRDGAYKDWAADMRRVARSTRALVKLSGLVTEAGPDWTLDGLKPYADLLLSEFGPERVIWGSDWPVVRLAAEYDLWFDAARQLTAHLSEADKTRIFGANAAAFYRL
jgi:L-fuconolactonase